MTRRFSRRPCKVLGHQTPPEVLQLILQKVFGLTLEFRYTSVSKTFLFDTFPSLPNLFEEQG
jgi:hypothetical protein